MRRQSPQRGAHSPRADGHFFFVAMAFGVLPFVTSLILGRPMQALVAGVISMGQPLATEASTCGKPPRGGMPCGWHDCK